jgi:hypothetical protein
MFDTFSIKNALQQGDALLSLLCKFALECAIMWFKAKWKGLKLNCVHQLLVYADAVNSLVKVYILYRKNREVSAVFGRETSQAVSADRTKCVYMSCEQNGGENYSVKIGDK